MQSFDCVSKMTIVITPPDIERRKWLAKTDWIHLDPMHMWGAKTRIRLISTESETERRDIWISQPRFRHLLPESSICLQQAVSGEPLDTRPGDLKHTDIGAWECDSSCWPMEGRSNYHLLGAFCTSQSHSLPTTGAQAYIISNMVAPTIGRLAKHPALQNPHRAVI